MATMKPTPGKPMSRPFSCPTKSTLFRRDREKSLEVDEGSELYEGEGEAVSGYQDQRDGTE